MQLMAPLTSFLPLKNSFFIWSLKRYKLQLQRSLTIKMTNSVLIIFSKFRSAARHRSMDEGRRKKENERLITKKRKRKGIPRRFVLSNENISVSESCHQKPSENFSSQDILDMARKGGNFLSCLIITNTGEDIIAKITSFCENCSCNTYIVSAVGSIARASLVQCGNALTYEGLYGIMSLTGRVSVSLTPGGSKGYKVVIGLVGNNGSVFAGDVSGPLIAASDVQILMRKSISHPEETSGQGSSSTVDAQRNKNEDSLNITKETRS